jgi:lysophospholipase L1-like esterase
VVSIPDWSVTPFASSDPRGTTAIAREVDEFNRLAREVASTTAAMFIDVTENSRLAAQDPTLLAADRLHPSGSMYAAWVELIFPAARRVLGT